MLNMRGIIPYHVSVPHWLPEFITWNGEYMKSGTFIFPFCSFILSNNATITLKGLKKKVYAERPLYNIYNFNYTQMKVI